MTRRRLGYLAGLLVAAVAIGVPSVVMASGNGAQISRTDVYAFPAAGEELGDPVGSSKLVRNEDGVKGQLKVDTLTPGDAYTLWWVIFNTPEGCSDACGEDDIFNGDGDFAPNPAANFSMAFADGKVVHQASANFEGKLPEGEPNGELFFGPGLVDSQHAEIHMVARSHGPALTGELLKAQISSFLGACDIQDCVDTHFAVHLAN